MSDKQPGETVNENKGTENKGKKDILATAARAIGSAVGAVAAAAGVHPHTDSAAESKAGRLPKKNKSRLPRRMKKAQARAHNVA